LSRRKREEDATMKMQHDNPTMSTRRARAMCRHIEKKEQLAQA